LQSVLNNSKWEELRLAMYGLGAQAPRWRVKDLSGYICPWDSEWFYHFRNAGYDSIEWTEIEVLEPTQDASVLAILQQIHLPGHRIDREFRVYGYVRAGEAMEYI
jgi:hypothetical protein